jgi:hypothetical protein
VSVDQTATPAKPRKKGSIIHGPGIQLRGVSIQRAP